MDGFRPQACGRQCAPISVIAVTTAAIQKRTLARCGTSAPLRPDLGHRFGNGRGPKADIRELGHVGAVAPEAEVQTAPDPGPSDRDRPSKSGDVLARTERMKPRRGINLYGQIYALAERRPSTSISSRNLDGAFAQLLYFPARDRVRVSRQRVMATKQLRRSSSICGLESPCFRLW